MRRQAESTELMCFGYMAEASNDAELNICISSAELEDGKQAPRYYFRVTCQHCGCPCPILVVKEAALQHRPAHSLCMLQQLLLHLIAICACACWLLRIFGAVVLAVTDEQLQHCMQTVCYML